MRWSGLIALLLFSLASGAASGGCSGDEATSSTDTESPDTGDADAADTGDSDVGDLSDSGDAAPDADDDAPSSPCDTPWDADLQLGTHLDDQVLSLLPAPDGGYVAAGFEAGRIGVASVDPSGDSVGFIVRIDRSGRELWRAEVATSSTDVIDALAFGPNGADVYFAGRTRGALPGFTNAGQFDLVVGRVDADGDGEIDAIVQTGDARPQHPRRLAFASTTSIVVSGYDDVYIPTNFVDRWEDPFHQLLSLVDGDIQVGEIVRFDTSAQDLGTALALPPDGVIVGGAVLGGSQSGSFVARFDAAGDEVWRRRIAGGSLEVLAALALRPDGTLLAAGSTYHLLGDESFGDQDLFLAELDPATGDVTQVTQAGTADVDYATDLVLADDGRAYVSGDRLAGDEQDGFVAVFTAEGQLERIDHFGTSASEFVYAIAVTACGDVLAAGSTDGSIVDGIDNAGDEDGFVVRVEPSDSSSL